MVEEEKTLCHSPLISGGGKDAADEVYTLRADEVALNLGTTSDELTDGRDSLVSHLGVCTFRERDKQLQEASFACSLLDSWVVAEIET